MILPVGVGQRVLQSVVGLVSLPGDLMGSNNRSLSSPPAFTMPP